MRCPVCGRKFDSEEQLEAHQQEHDVAPVIEHAGAGFACPTCGIEFDDIDQLIEHEATAHPAG